MKTFKSIPPLFWFLFGASELTYFFVFTRPFPLARFFTVIPPVDYTKLTRYSASGLFLFVGAVVILFWLYLWLPDTQPASAIVPYSGVVFAATLFFSYPVLAIDLFVYAILGRVWGLYGLNPLANAPADLPATDAWIGLSAEWAKAASPYGPLWEVINLAAFKVTGGNFLLHLFALKLIAILSYLAAVYLIGQILARLRPDWRLRGMIAFAWNPLVLLEVAQNGHNDMLMVALMLAAIWMLVSGKDRWVMPLLALSVLVKLMTIFIAPLFILYLSLKYPAWPRRIRGFAVQSLIFAAMVILPWLPLWPGLENWAVLTAIHGAGRSLMALSVLTFRALGNPAAFDMSRMVTYGSFLLLTLWFWWQNRSRFRRPDGLIFAAWAIFFWYVLLAAPVFHGWYLLWFLPLGILLGPESKPFYAGILFSFTALLVIPYFETVRVWYPTLLDNHLLGHAIGVSLLILPPALVALLNLKLGTNVGSVSET